MSTDPLVETPPLEPGDRLTREEFERRYDAMPELKKAELIDGVVYLPSPVSLTQGDYDSLAQLILSLGGHPKPAIRGHLKTGQRNS